MNPDIYTRRESEARSYCRSFPTSFVKASGSILTDEKGTDYIDFLAGCSSLNYGHNDPDMKAALIEHISNDGVTHGLDMHTEQKEAFLTAFEDIILKPRGMDHKVMMVGPTGTNAVEAAMKLARKTTGRHNIVAFTNGFHGMTMGALAATGNAGKRNGGAMPLQGVTHLPYDGAMGPDVNTLDQIEFMLENPSSGLDAPAAFLVEPVQGEGGLNAASAEWLRGIAALAKKNGALLILDDIQAGIGRTGTFFSFEEMGIEPDMVPMAKSLSGMGLPFAALLLKPELDVWKPAEHNGTFRGNTHAFVTARVALEKFWKDDSFQTELKSKARTIEMGLTSIADMVDGARLKGRGLMRGVDVGSGDLAEKICAEAFKRGLIIETSGAHDEVVKVLAPLTTTEEQFEKGFEILRDATRAALTENNQIAAE
ncbi:MAG: diaminobutyrate--2-oxoglutarate transaminase [Rhodobacteraceae bacterium]|jgi:diaminobutyrate-2-oxoglutarate transaminase|uniref:Diaminobutyrate--2-oxoglutarate transaminase n=1 Tax=Salipiger profundus TaxID=1229727 RepID=A0A1U7DC91_9RHOB|nr:MULTISPECIES: diaminobutyrate--2-oxoglutarate transaminase [Salipiger]APX25665.1 diaminobutyrate aminotransferase apoenzyme [Salipiger profundus]MAB06345.1 diaminobutyrate--2-oxoglutarate transaminase [Paracoccaceae bacterium]GGA04185.1 putative diaminobutyrate--2-oxoglutarate aminotransferase [Salipiger profundus]SFD54711.1 diaminobutyrate aminotransferase apoenzyme [Salipiger profundus]